MTPKILTGYIGGGIMKVINGKYKKIEKTKFEVETYLAKLKYTLVQKDITYPNLSDFWVFGKQYNSKDVYIKIRVEIVGRNYIFVMSFHFSTIPFEKVVFPFANS